jgi:hypothetical protein
VHNESSWTSSTTVVEGWVPQAWRNANIVPILKKGKDPGDVGTYRLIALTSHIGKLMERMITTRLSWWLEDSKILSPYQAGFRKGRFTTDQCLRPSQCISDGFQRKPPERTVLTLFDYSNAYDKVWRSGLLAKIQKAGIPMAYVR